MRGLGPADFWLLVAVGLIGLAIAVSLGRLSREVRRLRRGVARATRQIPGEIIAETHAIHAIHGRYPGHSMPTSNWSMRFTSLQAILELLDRHRPETLLELGSGLSTLTWAGWMREQGRGKVWSCEHDPNWRELTVSHLGRAGLAGHAEVRHTPLRSETGTAAQAWYDLGTLLQEIPPIDFVVVDGPPAGTRARRMVRYPALPVLFGKLSAGAVVVLDDARRPGERDVLNRWMSEFPGFRRVDLETATGLAVLTRAGS